MTKEQMETEVLRRRIQTEQHSHSCWQRSAQNENDLKHMARNTNVSNALKENAAKGWSNRNLMDSR